MIFESIAFEYTSFMEYQKPIDSRNYSCYLLINRKLVANKRQTAFI